MLYFSKLKIFIIYLTITILASFAVLNFFDVKNNYILSKKVNLGLDLQGGSYLLLEIDSEPVEILKLQNKLVSLRKILKELNIKYKNLNIKNKKISFNSSEDEINQFIEFFNNKDNLINNYYDK